MPTNFIFLDVPDSILVERVTGRMTDPETGRGYHATFDPPPTEEIKARCTRRDDDTEEKVGERLKAFHSQTMEILPSYSDVTSKINGDRPKFDITADVLIALATAGEGPDGTEEEKVDEVVVPARAPNSSSANDPTSFQLFQCSLEGFEELVNNMEVVQQRIGNIVRDMESEQGGDEPKGVAHLTDKLFAQVDKNNNGFLDRIEIADLRSALHIEDLITPNEIQRGFDEHDDDDSGTLDKSEFRVFVRWVLHYVMMVIVADVCDDPRFQFTNLDKLCRYAKGKGGGQFLQSRFATNVMPDGSAGGIADLDLDDAQRKAVLATAEQAAAKARADKERIQAEYTVLQETLSVKSMDMEEKAKERVRDDMKVKTKKIEELEGAVSQLQDEVSTLLDTKKAREARIG